jgi:hypothetical protein
MNTSDAVIIGGGLFGLSALRKLQEKGLNVLLLEKNSHVLLEASGNNHNRLHLGYHYLRSIDTAKQALDGFLSFLNEFSDAAVLGNKNYYAIAEKDSKCTPEFFEEFCLKVGIPYELTQDAFHLFSANSVQAVYSVPEPTIDLNILRNILLAKVNQNRIWLNSEVENIKEFHDNYVIELKLNQQIRSSRIINASYQNINKISALLDVDQFETVYEKVCIPIFQLDAPPIGLTVMDGPFCSIMPKGRDLNTFLLYHVTNSVLQNSISVDEISKDPASMDEIGKIYAKSKLFYPQIDRAKHLSTWEATRVIFKNPDDARLSQIKWSKNRRACSILSGKLATSIEISNHIYKHLFN